MTTTTTSVVWWYAVVFVAWIAVGVSSSPTNHRYRARDAVPFYVTGVLPYLNPIETYSYYSLPFCYPGNKLRALGEWLKGDGLIPSPYNLEFLVDKEKEVLCQKKLSRKEVADFRSAVSRDFLFEMQYDDLPIRGFLGKVVKNGSADPSQYKYYLYNHLHFEIFYNEDRVISIKAGTDPDDCVELTDDEDVLVEFLYSVKWNETDKAFVRRMKKYSRTYLEILSVVCLCLAVLLLTGFVVAILVQSLKNDLAKYALDEEATDDSVAAGWKLIDGDVFRFPNHKSLLAAALGSGTQLVIMAMILLLLAASGVSDPYAKETPFTTFGVMYTVTSFIAGYTAASFYGQLEGTNWVCNLVLTAAIFSAPLFLTLSHLSSVANAYKVVTALDSFTDTLLAWGLAASPLLVLGWVAGKYSMAELEAPNSPSKQPRQIPPLPWYRSTLPQMAAAGFLPFCASYSELKYIFSNLWGHRVCTSYTLLLLVFIIVLVVTAFTSVALTYFQLAAEDHEWWWRSFLYGGSSGLYVLGYCLYYYYADSDMSGVMQTAFFFGYMGCVCYAVFVMLGAVGFYSALFFVRRLYGSVKGE